jgi:hypothetical protein
VIRVSATLWHEIDSGRYLPGRALMLIVNRPVTREIFAARFGGRAGPGFPATPCRSAGTELGVVFRLRRVDRRGRSWAWFSGYAAPIGGDGALPAPAATIVGQGTRPEVAANSPRSCGELAGRGFPATPRRSAGAGRGFPATPRRSAGTEHSRLRALPAPAVTIVGQGIRPKLRRTRSATKNPRIY